MNRLFTASVIGNQNVCEGHYLLTLRPHSKISRPRPGNFFMLSIDSDHDPLLRRPFSVHRWLNGDFQILYRIAGRGTGILSKRKAGDTIEVMGPLGNAFPAPAADENIILVAGGLGIAPIFGLAESLQKKRPLLLYGARTKDEVLCLDGLRSLPVDMVISTDDGSLGRKGFVTGSLRSHLNRNMSPRSRCLVYACGPEPMLRSLSVLMKGRRLRCFAALEQNMACGIGTCLGCVVNTTDGYKRVCREGPVFPLEDIVW